MRLRYACPNCQAQKEADVGPGSIIRCECSWTREAPADSFENDTPTKCLVCSCGDLWRQKDFPQWLGLTMVAMGIIFSTIAWSQHMPLTALGILMFFALVDLLLYTFMGDMLVCYRCRARHRKMPIGEDHPNFDLEVAERYRQKQLRMKQAGK
ncbi:MAG: hypothetical protein AB8G99_00770 [Planctomycetaceae bacterium]